MALGLANQVAAGIDNIDHCIFHQPAYTDHAAVVRSDRIREGIGSAHVRLRFTRIAAVGCNTEVGSDKHFAGLGHDSNRLDTV